MVRKDENIDSSRHRITFLWSPRLIRVNRAKNGIPSMTTDRTDFTDKIAAELRTTPEHPPQHGAVQRYMSRTQCSPTQEMCRPLAQRLVRSVANRRCHALRHPFKPDVSRPAFCDSFVLSTANSVYTSQVLMNQTQPTRANNDAKNSIFQRPALTPLRRVAISLNQRTSENQ
jgi:hypothetical protein